MHEQSVELIADGLRKLGIILEDVNEYYPHRIGHFLGLDVQDCLSHETLKEAFSIPLEENMVITVEPGINLDQENPSIPEKYRGIGIRIEDNVVVTENGCKNLTTLPKTIEEIENSLAQV